MYVIKVFEKPTSDLWWTESHPTKERANEEVEHMKENHFNPQWFFFEVSEVVGNE